MLAAAVAISSWFSVRKLTEQSDRLTDRGYGKDRESFLRESSLITKAMAQSIAYQVTFNAYNEIVSSLEQSIVELNKKDGAEAWETRRRLHPRPEILWATMQELNELSSTPAWFGTTFAPTGEQFQTINGDLTRLGQPLGLDVRYLALSEDSGEVSSGGGGGRRSEGPQVFYFRTSIRYGNLPKAQLLVAVSDKAIHEEKTASARVGEQHVSSYRRDVWLVAGGIMVLGILFAAFQGLSLAQRITELTAQAARIAGGDLRSRVPVRRADELGELADNFNFMADQIGVLLDEQEKEVALKNEMKLARSVQQSMLPPDEVQEIANLKVVGYCSPASSCGGDWWMYRRLSGDRMLIVLGDAAGHGIHSAMIAATARGAVEALAALDERLLTPNQVLRALDSAIRNVGKHHVFMTAFAAVIDSTTGSLQYANAGQNFPYIVRRGVDRRLDNAVILATGGNPLGDQDIPVEIRDGVRELHPGDVFVCFTDGLVERSNAAGRLFGDRRLMRLMHSQPVDGGDDLLALRSLVVKSVEDYAGGEDAKDDVTLVLCQYDPPALSIQQRAGAG